jgi:ribonuclease VapC
MLGRYGEAADPMVDRFLRGLDAEVVPVDDDQVAIARDAAIRFGRGRHAASLNFGDCFSYALAISRGEPLLFVGEDLSRTDVVACEWADPG